MEKWQWWQAMTETTLKKEEELLCLLDMQRMILEICIDLYISRDNHSKKRCEMVEHHVQWIYKKQRSLSQNLAESDSDSDFDSEDDNDEFHDSNKVTNMSKEEEEDQTRDSEATVKERRLGLNINMRGTRDLYLC